MDSRENGPPPSEPDSETKPAIKKKKSSTQLGGFALAPHKNNEKPDAIDTAWSKLTLTKRRGGQTIERIPLAHVEQEGALGSPATVEPENPHTLPVEELAPDETLLVAQHIASERQAAEEEIPSIDAVSDSYSVRAAEAIEGFRSKIIREGCQVEEAFSETMQELEASAAPETAFVFGAVNSEAAEPEPVDQAMIDTRVPEELAPPVDMPARKTIRSEAVPYVTPISQPAAETNVRPRSSLVPSATELSPRGLGEYRLHGLARKDGHPSTERMPLHDELTLRNLPGGIVGYLIGRRRGRIKTEQKLAATRKKLEARVDDLQESIIAKENHIRKAIHMSKKESYEAPRQSAPESPRTLAMEANQPNASAMY
jgi:hypothetical protein